MEMVSASSSDAPSSSSGGSGSCLGPIQDTLKGLSVPYGLGAVHGPPRVQDDALQVESSTKPQLCYKVY